MSTAARVRNPQAAGLFYPEHPEALRAEVETLLARASLPSEGKARQWRAWIVPHAGYVYSGPVAAAAYRRLRELREQGALPPCPKVLLLGPAHFVAFSGAAADPADFWATPLGRVPVVNPGVEVHPEGLIKPLPEAYEREHSLEVQLPFLQVALGGFSIFPLVTGFVTSQALAEALEPAVERFDVLLVSSDLSHYHPYEESHRIDERTHRLIIALDVEGAELRSGVDACGKTAILCLMRWARARGWQAELLDYQTSGDTAGDRESVVGYGCYGFFEPE